MPEHSSLESIVAAYGAAAKGKLGSIAVHGEPEDQLRSPLETLIADVAELNGLLRAKLALVGESLLGELKTRSDFAVTYGNVLIGYIEVKAPGKGADPRRFRERHDKEQWKKLKALPNLLYTDGNDFSLWRDGELVGAIQRLEGDIETSGAELRPAAGLAGLLDDFLRWEPLPPRNARELALTTARLCRLLRDEVTEQLDRREAALTSLAQEWRHLLFPTASDAEFADGYAQAVTAPAPAPAVWLDPGVGWGASGDRAAAHLERAPGSSGSGPVRRGGDGARGHAGSLRFRDPRRIAAWRHDLEPSGPQPHVRRFRVHRSRPGCGFCAADPAPVGDVARRSSPSARRSRAGGAAGKPAVVNRAVAAGSGGGDLVAW